MMIIKSKLKFVFKKKFNTANYFVAKNSKFNFLRDLTFLLNIHVGIYSTLYIFKNMLEFYLLKILQIFFYLSKIRGN